jgi:hypothetical protein
MHVLIKTHLSGERVAQRGGAAKESQKAKGKTQKSKVKGNTSKTFPERGNRGAR